MSSDVSGRIQKRRQWWKEHKDKKDSDDQSQETPGKHESSIFKKGHGEKSVPLLKESKKGFRSTLQILQKVEETTITNKTVRDKTKRKKSHENDSHLSPKKKKTNTSDDGAASEEEPARNEEKQGKGKKKNQQKFVLFVGNLPFKADKENVQKHFERCGKIVSLRFPIDKATGKAKGFAFIEFEDRYAFKRGLLLHHSKMFGREINVEFTSIGGNSKTRTDKLRRKNLHLERFKRHRPQESQEPRS
ncbi:uncharacterized protein LOC135483844 [Lineus longissimus]|uniref:uncharacterized protein LOC135483844 n=1 Tax=Lineus longissimus TaxID=88925 RepID=UPI002B4C4BB0